ncbi:hypothetical protein LguiA_025987 [Lonicera macranthoides]
MFRAVMTLRLPIWDRKWEMQKRILGFGGEKTKDRVRCERQWIRKYRSKSVVMEGWSGED